MTPLRLALRRLCKEPSLSITAILTLAVGIGACTAMFSIIEAVLLRSIDVTAPDRVVVLWPEVAGSAGEFSYDAYLELQRSASSFADVALIGSTNWPVPIDLVLPDGRSVRSTQSVVSATFFDVLGARPLLGRTFVSNDERPGALPMVVLSAAFWRDKLGGDPAVIGRTIGHAQIIGVMPPEFVYPTGADFWAPAAALLSRTVARNSPAELEKFFESVNAFHVIARLKPGVSAARGAAESAEILRRSPALHVDPTVRVVATALPDRVFGQARRALWLLFGAVGLILVIACANVAGLQLARAAAHTREAAIRLALGATSWHLARQRLTEAAVLAIVGGVLGLAAAAPATRVLVRLTPTSVVRLTDARVDVPALGAAIAFTCIAVLLVGLLPVAVPSRHSLASAQGTMVSRTADHGVRGHRRRALVVGQTAMALALAMASTVAVQSFIRVATLDLGFQASSLLAVDMSRLDQSRYRTYAVRHRLVEDVLSDLARRSGVRSAAAVTNRPFAHGAIGWDTSVLLEGQTDVEATWLRNPIVNWEGITPRYFETMGIKLIRGRDFGSEDRADSPFVAIVSEALAAQAWPGQVALGKRLMDGLVGRGSNTRPKQWQTVVGVVANARYRDLAGPRADLYVPIEQASEFDVGDVVIRTTGEPEAIVPQVGALLSRIDPGISAAEVAPMAEIVDHVQAPWRFNMILFSMFGVASIILTAMGVVGLVASTVTWRRGEIAIRLALGADATAVVRSVTLDGAKPVVTGVLVGLGAFLLMARVISSLRFGPSSGDPIVLVAVALGITALGIMACYLPARRAASVDPSAVFREG
jgi:putative ABC transport system permease protein